ncbi:hypothetical protein JB92DRAFT_1458886 [Gautieria morchelliformis]|nr:hypothetical protein JB92DRAFT_1458886 [Gautieria morchelliformis]
MHMVVLTHEISWLVNYGAEATRRKYLYLVEIYAIARVNLVNAGSNAGSSFLAMTRPLSALASESRSLPAACTVPTTISSTRAHALPPSIALLRIITVAPWFNTPPRPSLAPNVKSQPCSAQLHEQPHHSLPL